MTLRTLIVQLALGLAERFIPRLWKRRKPEDPMIPPDDKERPDPEAVIRTHTEEDEGAPPRRDPVVSGDRSPAGRVSQIKFLAKFVADDVVDDTAESEETLWKLWENELRGEGLEPIDVYNELSTVLLDRAITLRHRKAGEV